MAYFDCIVGGSGKGNTLVVTCADELAGATITCTNGTKTYTKTCPSTSPYEVTFYGLMAGTWTVSATVSGNTYTTTVVVVDCAALLGGFNWRTWVDTAQFLDSSDYDSLSEVLEDELAIRELCLEHACVDYMAEIATGSADVETIINTDLFAKWVNNSDYALDFLHANAIIADYMDTADKYFYGEWALMPQVPTMTSNTAPLGEAFANSEMTRLSRYAWKVFDGDNTSIWMTNNGVTTPSYIGYHFVNPIIVRRVKYCTIDNVVTRFYKFKVQASNDGNTWVDLTDELTTQNGGWNTIDIDSEIPYSYYRLYCTQTIDNGEPALYSLQFYAYAPKGNVPIMTSNSAPYGEVSASSSYSPCPPWHAFDGSDQISGDNYVWASGDGVRVATLTYKSVSPIRVAMLMIQNGIYTQKSVKDFIFQGSNDGSTWENLLSDSNPNTAGQKNYYIIPDANRNYYLYHRISVSNTHGSENILIANAQFYGRELSVSVPKMDTNTTPYGEAFADNEAPLRPAYKAFDGGTAEENTWFTTGLKGSLTNKGIGYTFTNKMIPKMAVLKFYNSGSLISTVSYKFQGYNGTTWEDLSASITDKTGTICVFDNTSEYDTIRLFLVSQNMNNSNADTGGVSTLQFYGLDYSEKEFEEGTTKKWLYDHGVELVEMGVYTQSGTTEKRSSSLYVQGNSGNYNAEVHTNNAIDLTNYSVYRAKLINCLRTCILYVGNAIPINYGDSAKIAAGSANDTPINNPNTLALGVSAFNENKYIVASTGSNGSIEISEMWLE